ncbi:MAG: dTDP-4-dehydrorhamnose reductase [Desulfobulbaceae bacterium]|nr:MAG: dTDP-4-dehydrorhamnose reductase [Desulfobulbaceae bacterium]
MRVLVTGAKGQVGAEIVRQGRNLGLDMMATGRAALDITRQDAVNRFIQAQQPDIVINAAAYTAVDRAESEPEPAYAVNRDGAACLARACAANNIPLLHLSTDYIFDGRQQGAYSETDPPNPQGIYGKSKLAGDRAIESILEQHLILRVSWVFGVDGNNFVKTMLRLGKERDVLKVVADQHGGPTWAGAIAETLLGLVKRRGDGEAISWGTYHYSGQPVTTWQAFAKAIFEQADKLGMIDRQPRVEPITTAEYPTPAQRPLNSVFDCHKITQVLGISQPDWRTGLDKVLKKWRKS